jgi:hypothetical protein
MFVLTPRISAKRQASPHPIRGAGQFGHSYSSAAGAEGWETYPVAISCWLKTNRCRPIVGEFVIQHASGLANLSCVTSEVRANHTPVDAMRGGTFTLTNVGVFGVDGATPILNPGEAAILALGQTRKLPWNHKDQVRRRSVTTELLSFDHRLVDGELGSTVLAEIAELLEHPAHAMAR